MIASKSMLTSFYDFCQDKVLCHFCFKPRKVTEEVLKSVNGRKSQMLISDIIVLKTALDAIPFLSKVNKSAHFKTW